MVAADMPGHWDAVGHDAAPSAGPSSSAETGGAARGRARPRRSLSSCDEGGGCTSVRSTCSRLKACASTRPRGGAFCARRGRRSTRRRAASSFRRRTRRAAIATATKEFALGGRRADWSFALNAGGFSLCADGGSDFLLDRHTGERRAATFEDWLEVTRVLDALDDVGMYWCMIESGFDWSTPAGMVDYLTHLFGTFGRHVQDSYDTAAVIPWLTRALEIVFGSREEVRRRHPFSFLLTPASPLIIEEHYTDAWLAARGYDIPVAVMPMPLMGATAPGAASPRWCRPTARCWARSAWCRRPIPAHRSSTRRWSPAWTRAAGATAAAPWSTTCSAPPRPRWLATTAFRCSPAAVAPTTSCPRCRPPTKRR